MSFTHPKADMSSCSLGHGTTILQFDVILERATIGKSIVIGAGPIVANDVS